MRGLDYDKLRIETVFEFPVAEWSMSGDVNEPARKYPVWTEITVTVPVDARDAVIGWFMDRGSAGVQEDYPGLFPLDGNGPVTSGDPREWHGEATPNPGDTVVLKGWLPPRIAATREAAALRSFLESTGIALPDGRACPVDGADIESVDWNAIWKSQFKPIQIGRRFTICPTWEEPPRDGRIVIMLDPGMAFGTGTHFTTASCIEAAEDFFDRVETPSTVSVLDVGTGSGILAIAALKMGAGSAFGIDVDPDAARESQKNAAANGAGERYGATDRPITGKEGQFNLVFANILAQTLMVLAPMIAATVAPKGSLITSGILVEYEGDVVKSFKSLGFDVISARHDDSWATVTFEKSGC